MAKSTRSGYSNIRANPPTELVTDGPVGAETDVATEDVAGRDAVLEGLLSLTMSDLLVIAEDEGADVPRKATKSDVIAAIEANRA